MKPTIAQKARTVFAGPEDTWTALGDQLRQKYPELVEQVAKQKSDQVVGRLVDQVCDLFPYNWEDRNAFYEGMILMIRGHNVTALGVFTEICEQDPKAYAAQYFLGYVCGSMGKYKQEVECYRKALRLRPDICQFYFDLACSYEALNNLPKAYEAMKRAVNLEPDFDVLDHWLTFASDNLGRFLDIYGNEEKALAEKARCVSMGYYLVGNALLEVGLNASARQAFKNAVRIEPEFSSAYFQLGVLHLKKLRNKKRASQYLGKAETLFKKKGDVKRARFTQQLLKGNESNEIDESSADAWLQEGLRLHKQGRYQAAVDVYKMAIKFRPDFLDAYYNMGIAYGSLEDQGLDTLDNAIGAFKHSIRLGPEFIHAYIALGAAYLRKGQAGEAVDLLEKATEFAPENPNLFFYLGNAYRSTQRYDDAVRVLEHSARLAPDSVHARFTLGLVLMDSRLYEKAATALKETLRIKPDLADAYLLLGQLNATHLKNPEQARLFLEKGEKLCVKLKDFQKADKIREILSQLDN
ncbi:MAG: tetratricopeptide repeat protein [Candidatus Nitronauta litoralis]|uniref:Tetratricopeptide repeat protein n=1 Tax=Candidatus Nitronauta litoralis TaxID=2705533 RepID=A0A7T0BWQ4_9BACT|nr:MAG: tetratricopeptide repeat protein [Candidatus Nitronauta litoralis]